MASDTPEASPDEASQTTAHEDMTQLSDIPGNSTGKRRSALPSEPASSVGDEPPSEDSPDSEGDEASDDEIHDLALAVESAGFTPHGHEVTSQPTDEDQGEAIRIVTEAVESGGGPARPAPPVPAAATPPTPTPPAAPGPGKSEDRGSHQETPRDGDES